MNIGGLHFPDGSSPDLARAFVCELRGLKHRGLKHGQHTTARYRIVWRQPRTDRVEWFTCRIGISGTPPKVWCSDVAHRSVDLSVRPRQSQFISKLSVVEFSRLTKGGRVEEVLWFDPRMADVKRLIKHEQVVDALLKMKGVV